MRRCRRAASASGPPSTSSRAAGGASTSNASPCPTSRAVSVRTAGARAAPPSGQRPTARTATSAAAADRGARRPRSTTVVSPIATGVRRCSTRNCGPPAKASPAHRTTASAGVANHATTPPAAVEACATRAIATPTADAAAAAGTATRFAGRDANGTAPWEWSSTGATPSWAPMLAARSTRSGRGPGRRGASAGPTTSTPAVASTDRLNPSCPATSGSARSSSTTAIARTWRASRPRPVMPARSTSAAITPARSTDGSARTSRANQARAAMPVQRRARAPMPASCASARTPASTSATLEPDTATRCDRPASVSSPVRCGV